MAGEASDPQAVADEGERILNNMRESHYQYPPFKICEETGTYDVDCSGFVSYILGRIAPEHYGEISIADGQPVPQAFEYYEFFSLLPASGSGGWSRIERLADIGPGDLIVWQLSPSDSDAEGDTGHIIIVADAPLPLDDGSLAITVYDSSNILHYDDSRLLSDGERKTGVGTGTIHFKVDGTTGSPTAFKFGPGDGYQPSSITIGRLGPMPPDA